MLARQLLAVLPLLLALAHGQEAAPAATATAAKKTSSSSSHHTGPFSAFTKSLPQEKKKPFMELMKRLRSAKAATGAPPRRAATALRARVHRPCYPLRRTHRQPAHPCCVLPACASVDLSKQLAPRTRRRR